MVVDKPPVPPNNSPNLDTKLNTACAESLNRVAFLLTDNTPIRIPLSLFFAYSTKDSFCEPATASAKLE